MARTASVTGLAEKISKFERLIARGKEAESLIGDLRTQLAGLMSPENKGKLDEALARKRKELADFEAMIADVPDPEDSDVDAPDLDDEDLDLDDVDLVTDDETL